MSDEVRDDGMTDDEAVRDLMEYTSSPTGRAYARDNVYTSRRSAAPPFGRDLTDDERRHSARATARRVRRSWGHGL